MESSATAASAMEIDGEEDAGRQEGDKDRKEKDVRLDCYPYTFSPLLLFAESSYFDKGYSNYNSVQQFFSSVLPADLNLLLGTKVLYERKNMMYEDLLDFVVRHEMVVTCCIDDHFTAFQVLHVGGNDKSHGKPCLVYYDPTSANLQLVSDRDGFQKLALYLMLKCNYGDSQHVQENKGHYTNNTAETLLSGKVTNPKQQSLRKTIYNLWKNIHQIQGVHALRGVSFQSVPLCLEKYVLLNNPQNPALMSTQLTSNTCYFQTFWFVVLCQCGQLRVRHSMRGGSRLEVEHVDRLEETAVAMSRFLLEFFVQTTSASSSSSIKTTPTTTILRPLTNSNFILDFYRYQQAPYFATIQKYLQQYYDARRTAASSNSMDSSGGPSRPQQLQLQQHVPDYEAQFRQVLQYYQNTKCLHTYDKFTFEGPMSSTPNTKSLQLVTSCGSGSGYGGSVDDSVRQLARSDYYKYRAANFMFGFNAGILSHMESFCEFNAWRKNQLLRYLGDEEVYENGSDGDDDDDGKGGGTAKAPRPSIQSHVSGIVQALAQAKGATKYRDYYFMPQFEVGQQQLIDLHHYTYLVDLCSRDHNPDAALAARFHEANHVLIEETLFSTQKNYDYEKILTKEDVKRSKKILRSFVNSFMSIEFLSDFIGLGFADINLKEKDVNSLTQTVFYTTDLASQHSNRRSAEFEKECINQMARSNLRQYNRRLGQQDKSQKYKISLRIGQGYTYSKYNTLMHFLNVVECYWRNPDLSNVQLFGKDIRVLLVISSQKLFFEESHSGYYHYGPILNSESQYRSRADLDLAVAQAVGHIVPTVSQRQKKRSEVIIADRVFEFSYLKSILEGLFHRAKGVQLKTDNEVLNLCLLSLMLDFGLYQKYSKLLNLSFLKSLQHEANQQELQVECANLIYEFDRKNTSDSVTRSAVEELIFETSYKFLVNKDFPVQSKQFQLIRTLNSDPDYQSYVLLIKVYMSLCQINKSVEVDYYKVNCDGGFRIIIPHNFSKATSDYLIEVTKRYTFSERNDIMIYDEHAIFDLTPQQPDIHLFKVRLDSSSTVQSMVKYIELSHAFKVLGESEQYLVFIADNVLLIEVSDGAKMTIWINKVAVEIATMFFNEAISFIPCFKYAESEDVVLFTSRDIHYLVDKGGQFCTDYYGMKHELIDCIKSEEVFVDLNDDHVFKTFKLSELLTESKTVLFFPDYLLQVSDRQHLINLLDLAIHLRNVSFFCLVLFYLWRTSVKLEFIGKEGATTKISGPWRAAILYVLKRSKGRNDHYNGIFQRQFFDLNQHENVPLVQFIDILCENFTKYQRFIDGEYQIIPTPKQKEFLRRIICADECFHFSEVGSGKTKVILPLLCQMFLSNNAEAHRHLSRGGKLKDVLVILVPEHLVSDARTQVFRYCLNLNFREEYRVYDDIFALLNKNVKLRGSEMKQIFVTSFNQFKKALTYDSICSKVRPHREHILVIADEVDDFLDRDKLVFNICSNKSSTFDRSTLNLFFEVSRAAYNGQECPVTPLESSENPGYWEQLFLKFGVIHSEIQHASRSINKSFGIFNEYTLRHCSTNITHDIEGYKSLIARPYESVNRAMAGSYYSDVERTIYLTYVVLIEDITKYDDLFQGERKYITFEYWNAHFLHHLEFDDLVYGHEKLSEIAEKHPETRDGLTRFLYEIILRRMEIRDESRSVNSVDIIFNFDCIGFTGTPFLDNYPTFDYIRRAREDEIPDMIDRNFYAYTSDALPQETFEERFSRFQGRNNRVAVKYVPSDFISDASSEMEILRSLFLREEQTDAPMVPPNHPGNSEEGAQISSHGFNAIVDLCGVFKRSTIHDVRDLIRQHFGADRFRYVYHIGQADNSDRVLYMNSDNDVLYDEEFYRYLCSQYGAGLRERVFFFVDNRNVIGKDIPFQLVYQRHYGQPLLTKAVVLAHDVDDFSKIWQAMGRSRTMNDTVFSVYKSGIGGGMADEEGVAHDIKGQALTRKLYIKNCDSKMAGNISSIYLTLVALNNLSENSFYYRDTIVNTFLEKMERTIAEKVARLATQLRNRIMGSSVLARILLHILRDKFRRSPNKIVSSEQVVEAQVETLLGEIVEHKFEQRPLSGDSNDEFIRFLSGEQEGSMEISYTKQQQKQKQKQQNKNQDSDAMGIFNKLNQLCLTVETDNYFKYTLKAEKDMTKLTLNLPSPVPILTIKYLLLGSQRTINVYPTLQFLYSHHIDGSYITSDIKDFFQVSDREHAARAYNGFCKHVGMAMPQAMEVDNGNGASVQDPIQKELDIQVVENKIRQSPEYTLAGLKEGVYVVGMKDQFNLHDLPNNPLCEHIQHVADEVGFVLYDKTTSKSVDSFGPYFIENYIILEVLSKQEVAQNVLDYYCNHKETLQRGLDTYDEAQGKGFVSWRFLMNETAKIAAKNEKRKRYDEPAE